MNLNSDYRHFEFDKCIRDKNSFITPDSLCEFKLMPFELCMACATFQRVMDTVVAALKWKTCFLYLDDVTMFSGTFKRRL